MDGVQGGRCTAEGTGYEMIVFCSVWKEVGGNDSLERIRMRENGFRGSSLSSPVLTVPSSGLCEQAQGRASGQPALTPWREEQWGSAKGALLTARGQPLASQPHSQTPFPRSACKEVGEIATQVYP